ncbi:MAG TPA: SDR family oxidoreductase [Burkholderiales bacterium]|nr:SDR family oxidoreductase [Burkholderiales bacterium]
MTDRLKGKVAIVTGAGSQGELVGNGAATAILFAREGARVLCTDLVEERAEATVAAIRREGGIASAFRADVANGEDCAAMVAACVERYGRLDVLDNNVGISVRADVLEVTEAQWDRVMAVNVKSIMLAAKHAIPHMVRAGGGSIINISSVAGLRANQSTPYTTSKAAIVGMTRSMAGDHGPHRIRVNCIVPGLIYGPMTAPRMDEALRQTRRAAAPLGTEGTGWDVAWAAVFLASDEARWITGVALPVDAGFLVMSPTTRARLAAQRV